MGVPSVAMKCFTLYYPSVFNHWNAPFQHWFNSALMLVCLHTKTFEIWQRATTNLSFTFVESRLNALNLHIYGPWRDKKKMQSFSTTLTLSSCSRSHSIIFIKFWVTLYSVTVISREYAISQIQIVRSGLHLVTYLDVGNFCDKRTEKT